MSWLLAIGWAIAVFNTARYLAEWPLEGQDPLWFALNAVLVVVIPIIGYLGTRSRGYPR